MQWGGRGWTITRVGNTLVLRLVAHQTLADIGKIFGMFSPGFMADGREFQADFKDYPGLLVENWAMAA